MTCTVRKHTLSKFTNDLIGQEGCAAMQRDLDRLEKLTDGNLTQFSKGNCEVLHWGGTSGTRTG